MDYLVVLSVQLEEVLNFVEFLQKTMQSHASINITFQATALVLESFLHFASLNLRALTMYFIIA